MSKKIIYVVLGGVLVFCLSTSIVLAAEFRWAEKGGNVSVAKDEVVKNLYTAGNMVYIDGDIAKSLHAAGNIVAINGNVENDICVGGGTIIIRGDVGGSVHAGGGNILIEGKITGDLFVGGGNITISQSASVGGDLIIGGGIVNIEGPVAGDVLLRAGLAVINSKIGGQVKGQTDELKIGSQAEIAGDLIYKSPKEAEISDQAKILGEIDFEKKVAKEMGFAKGSARLYGLLTLAFLLKILISIAVGLVLIYLFKEMTKKIVKQSLTSFWLSLSFGFSALILTPVAMVIFLITIIGIGLTGLLGLFYALMVALALTLAPIAFGSWIIKLVKKRDKYTINWSTVVVGVITLNIVVLVPFIGWLVGFVFMLISLGALYRTIHQSLIKRT